jgi:hypothetical protein
MTADYDQPSGPPIHPSAGHYGTARRHDARHSDPGARPRLLATAGPWIRTLYRRRVDPLFRDRRVLKAEDRAEIRRRLHRAEGVPIMKFARRMVVAPNTVRATLASDKPPKYERAPKGSVADAYEPAVRALLREWPTMPAPVIAQRDRLAVFRRAAEEAADQDPARVQRASTRSTG